MLLFSSKSFHPHTPYSQIPFLGLVTTLIFFPKQLYAKNHSLKPSLLYHSSRLSLIMSFTQTSFYMFFAESRNAQTIVCKAKLSGAGVIVSSAICRSHRSHPLSRMPASDLVVIGWFKADENFSLSLSIFITSSVARKVRFCKRFEACVRLGTTFGINIRCFCKKLPTLPARMCFRVWKRKLKTHKRQNCSIMVSLSLQARLCRWQN